jgi:hypothetical protein
MEYTPLYLLEVKKQIIYKVVQIWSGQTVTCLHTNSPGHILTTLYYAIEHTNHMVNIYVLHFTLF